MVYAKTELFDILLQNRAGLFKALAHPARLQILKYLSETKSCISGDISQSLPLSRTTVNQHLNLLKEAGLIKGEIEGINTNYCLNSKKIEELKQETQDFLSEITTDKVLNC